MGTEDADLRDEPKVRDVSKVKLVHVTTVPISLIVLVGGQAHYMSERGFSVYGISSSGELLDVFSKQQQVPVFAVEMTRAVTPLKDLYSLFSLWRLLSKTRPHIVHSHTPKAGLLGTLAAWLARVPIRIYHMHGLRFRTERGFKRALLKWGERFACLLAHRTVCVSQSVFNLALEDRLCHPDKLTVLLQGGYAIDAIERFNPANVVGRDRKTLRRDFGVPENALLMGYVGRIVRDKGLVELMEAWDNLRVKMDHLHWLVVGPFEDQDPLPTGIVDRLKSDPRIHCMGSVPAENMPTIYQTLDVLILPSYREGFPLSLLEAAAMELPVVATRVEGCVDAVQDKITGMLVEPHDAKVLTEAIWRYLADPDLRERHGRAGRERVLRDFRPEAIWSAIYQEYLDLLSARNLPLPEADR